jgi:hypothetical protein
MKEKFKDKERRELYRTKPEVRERERARWHSKKYVMKRYLKKCKEAGVAPESGEV